jgi:hypothetical protein
VPSEKAKGKKNVATAAPGKAEPPELSTGPAASTMRTGGGPSAPNPRLDSFDALMSAMDAELARVRPTTTSHADRMDEDKVGGQGEEVDEEEIEANMDAELDALLKRDPADEDAPVDYTLIKNLLESYKNQAGGPGPASNIVGRLDPSFNFPRDASS